MAWKRLCMALGMTLVSMSFISCSLLGFGKKEPSSNDPYGLEAYQRAGGRIGGFGAGGATAGVTPASGVPGPSGAMAGGRSPVSGAGITPDEDIEWAPEDPNQPIGGGLEELWKQPENKVWHLSYKEASQQARQSGKPMLIWFTDSMHSPLCRRLGDELFSTSEFEGWATEKLVRLRVDTTIKERNPDLRARKTDYVKKLKKRYGVHGYPTVLVLMPSGEVQAKYRGYKKGGFEYYWARMKQAVVKAEEGYGRWREKYEKRGYRLWTSRDGRKVFAKLHRFKPGRITLIDPDGRRGVTSFKKLSDSDQAWIQLQKKEYEARKRP